MNQLNTQIASFLKLELIGKESMIEGFSSLNNIGDRMLVFAKKYTKENEAILNANSSICAIVTDDFRGKLKVPHIISENPRLDYIKAITHFFVAKEVKAGIDGSSIIEDGAVVGQNVSIGSNCYIGEKVIIGDNCEIMSNVSIIGSVVIGDHCVIKSGAVIGGAGFGFEYDRMGNPIHFPHTGGVRIGNNVHIGSNTCIDRATINNTYIGDNVKIDNLCQIAHNCIIGNCTLITSGASLCGGVKVGKNCWIGPNSVIYQQIAIADNSKVGIGSVVLRKVKEGKTVFGNPAKITEYE